MFLAINNRKGDYWYGHLVPICYLKLKDSAYISEQIDH